MTIGYDLGISPRTTEIYRANLMTKMEAESLSDLVRSQRPSLHKAKQLASN
jgi:FixJ family two-component response regulator